MQNKIRLAQEQKVPYMLVLGDREIFGILGPNGAGKTTTVESIAGLRDPDGGSIRVLGSTRAATATSSGEVLGVQLQESELPDRIAVREALDLYASFYERPPILGAARSTTSASPSSADTPFRKLSGGQKQRLSIALALVGNPRIAVLDELTTGLDPQARRDTWDAHRGHPRLAASRSCSSPTSWRRPSGSPIGSRCIDGGRDRRPRHARRASSPGSTPSSASASGPSAPFDDAMLTDLPEVRSVTRSGPTIIVAGHRQPRPCRDRGAGPPRRSWRNDLRIEQAGPRRRVHRADRPPAAPTDGEPP